MKPNWKEKIELFKRTFEKQLAELPSPTFYTVSPQMKDDIISRFIERSQEIMHSQTITFMDKCNAAVTSGHEMTYRLAVPSDPWPLCSLLNADSITLTYDWEQKYWTSQWFAIYPDGVNPQAGIPIEHVANVGFYLITGRFDHVKNEMHSDIWHASGVNHYPEIPSFSKFDGYAKDNASK
jgi:hypothetical protein